MNNVILFLEFLFTFSSAISGFCTLYLTLLLLLKENGRLGVVFYMEA